MDHEDGERVGQAALDAVGFVQERFLDASLVSVVVILTIEDDDDIYTVTHSWPGKDGADV